VNNAAFLLIVVVISVPVSMYLWLRSRKPTTFMSSIEDFQREMSALAHDPTQDTARRRRSPEQVEMQPIVPSGPTQGLAEKIRAAQRLRQDAEQPEPRGRRRAKRR
jgi:hypothetical protein